jgi:hypothetical protein
LGGGGGGFQVVGGGGGGGSQVAGGGGIQVTGRGRCLRPYTTRPAVAIMTAARIATIATKSNRDELF